MIPVGRSKRLWKRPLDRLVGLAGADRRGQGYESCWRAGTQNWYPSIAIITLPMRSLEAAGNRICPAMFLPKGLAREAPIGSTTGPFRNPSFVFLRNDALKPVKACVLLMKPYSTAQATAQSSSSNHTNTPGGVKGSKSRVARLNDLGHEKPAAKAMPLGIARVLIGAFIIFCAPLLAQAQQPPSANANSELAQLRLKTPSNTLPRNLEYLICPDDQLEIYVLNVPELSRQYRVDSNGLLALPLLADPISAAGLTLAGLSRTIGDRLRQAGMVSNPYVTVQVKESSAHSITIIGAVKRPDVYALIGKTTLLDALSQAEGIAEDASNIAIITRGGMTVSRLESGPEVADRDFGAMGPNLSRTVTVDLNRLLEDGDSSLNVDLYPGDRVAVRRAGIVYVVGAVKRAGAFALKDDRKQMTILKAVALADNITSTALPRKAKIVRKNADRTEEIPVDLAKILSGRAPDSPLQSNDILFVPDSSSKRALHRAGEVAAQAATLLIYRIP